jgi:hypothetical protein
MINTNNVESNSSIFKTITNNLMLEMPSIDSSLIAHPKHLCIRLSTGPQYYS